MFKTTPRVRWLPANQSSAEAELKATGAGGERSFKHEI